MNLSGTICYLQLSIYSKTSKNNLKNLNFLYFNVDIRLKELYNSNDFSELSVIHQNLLRFYNPKDNFSIDKKLSLITGETCSSIEEDRLRRTFFKGIKNFSFWHYFQWTLEKEFFFKFFFLPTFFFTFLSVNPSNYYTGSWIGSLVKTEKTKTWIILLFMDILIPLDLFKEVYWNLKLISISMVKKINKDIFFNLLSSNHSYYYYCTRKKFLNEVLMTTKLRKGNMIYCSSIIMEIQRYHKTKN